MALASRNSSSNLWLVFLLLLGETVVNGSQEYRRFLRSGDHHSPRSITISGTAFCDTCHESRLTESSFIFKDAKILVECDNFTKVIHTNDKGHYTIKLGNSKSHKASCSTTLLSSSNSTSCNISSSTTLSYQIHQDSQEDSQVQDLIYKPRGRHNFSFCPRSEALSLGPPDPPQPSSKLQKSPPAKTSSMSNSESSKKVESYHLGPPDPPRPSDAIHNGRPWHG